MLGDSLMNVPPGYDTVRYNEPMGVFAGIAPWNFPAMIPQGWMVPICIVTGNCMVLKAASFVPQTAMRITELWREAGLPAGVLNIVTTSRNEAEIFLTHPGDQGRLLRGIHQRGPAHLRHRRGQRQAGAGSHGGQEPRPGAEATAVLERAAQGIINSFCGCAGERCMALPVVVVENAIADQLVERLVRRWPRA